MKKYFFTIILILISNFILAQNVDKEIYADLGAWKVNVDENKISISAFVTIQEEIEKKNIYEINRNKKESSIIFDTLFRYELYLESNSIYENKLVNTWIYGARVFINDAEITKEQFPKGFMFLIENEPTLVYWYRTSKSNMDFSITWESAVYESKLFNDNY